MRHGPAEDVAESGRDFDRALTSAGRTRVRRVADLLVSAGEAPARIFASPLVRTQQTAAIVAEVAALPAPTRADPLAPGYDARAFLDGLLAAPEANDRAMVVGHEPDMSDLAHYVLRDAAGAAGFGLVGFEKAMVVAIDVQGGVATLARVLDPRELKLS